MELCLIPDTEEINPQEDAALRATVAKTLVACPLVAVQTAVTTADVALGQDWSQEGRRLLREWGLMPCASPALMAATC